MAVSTVRLSRRSPPASLIASTRSASALRMWPIPTTGAPTNSAAAAATARRIGSRHHAIRVTARSFRAEFDRFSRHGDQPFAVSSGLGILAVARRRARRGSRCCSLATARTSASADIAGIRISPAPGTMARSSGSGVVSFQNFGVPLADRLAVIDAHPDPARAWAWHYYAHEDEKAALFAPEFRAGLASSLRQFDGFRTGPWRPVDFIAQDRAFYFPNEMLRKVDRMTMAYSVEGRVPFAAPAVLSHADKLRFQRHGSAGRDTQMAVTPRFCRHAAGRRRGATEAWIQCADRSLAQERLGRSRRQRFCARTPRCAAPALSSKEPGRRHAPCCTTRRASTGTPSSA